MLVIETLKSKISDFLNRTMCFTRNFTIHQCMETDVILLFVYISQQSGLKIKEVSHDKLGAWK